MNFARNTRQKEKLSNNRSSLAFGSTGALLIIDCSGTDNESTDARARNRNNKAATL
jgi:hypothetical protein